jgi:hypothetical protein
MPLKIYEGVVEKGQIRLNSGVKLPENVKVLVVVPDLQAQRQKTVRVMSPRLTRRKQAGNFKMKIGKA